MISIDISLYQLAVMFFSSALGSVIYSKFWPFIQYIVVRINRKERMKRLGSEIAICYTYHYYEPEYKTKVLKKFREIAVTENDIKNIFYGSIRELTKERTYYYKSSYKPHFTDEGKKVVMDMLDLYAEKIQQAIEAADDQRAKDMVMKTLKGDE